MTPLAQARRLGSALLVSTLLMMLAGCAVVAVADAAATVAVKTVGVATDAAVGTVRIVGKGVGKAADAAVGGDKDAK